MQILFVGLLLLLSFTFVFARSVEFDLGKNETTTLVSDESTEYIVEQIKKGKIKNLDVGMEDQDQEHFELGCMMKLNEICLTKKIQCLLPRNNMDGRNFDNRLWLTKYLATLMIIRLLFLNCK